jgi:transcriptional regulator GlxA family with amidase domain
MKEEILRLEAENARLKEEISSLKNEMIRLVRRNLDLTERLEEDIDMRRRIEVAREMFQDNIQRQRNADLQNDDQLMALIELRLEEKRLHLNADFGPTQLAELLGISVERLNRLFRNQTIYRTPEAYIDNLRTLNALRLLRTKPNYNIASVAEDSGFNHVRTMQRRIMDVVGMTPADYRALFTRDL